MSGIDWIIDIVRREAAHAFSNRQQKSTLVVTSYDPDKHAVKGILLPSKTESGWMPIATGHIGNGFGMAIGPKVGSAEKLDGDQFNVEFENGDQSTPVASQRLFSKQDKPPRVESGEMILKREDGGSIFFDKDGAITTTHKDGGYVKIDKDGNHELNSNNKNVTINAGSGSTSMKAKSFDLDGPVKINGAVTSTESFSAPLLNGTVSGP